MQEVEDIEPARVGRGFPLWAGESVGAGVGSHLMGTVFKVIGVVLFLGAITAFDYFVDLPSGLGMPELFDCVSRDEIASGERGGGFQFCGP